jgi:predicted kinase
MSSPIWSQPVSGATVSGVPHSGVELLVTFGISGAGKSTWAASQPHLHVSVDRIRNEPMDRMARLRYCQRVEKQAKRAIAAGQSVVFDGCNLNPHQRHRWLMLGRQAGARTIMVKIPLDLPTALSRRPFLAPLIYRQAEEYRAQEPRLQAEGWDGIRTLY